jgi:hypothetical protein
MLIDKRFEAILDENDLQIAFGPLAQAFKTVERLVKSCHQIEENLGSLLSKATPWTVGRLPPVAANSICCNCNWQKPIPNILPQNNLRSAAIFLSPFRATAPAGERGATGTAAIHPEAEIAQWTARSFWPPPAPGNWPPKKESTSTMS